MPTLRLAWDTYTTPIRSRLAVSLSTDKYLGPVLTPTRVEIPNLDGMAEALSALLAGAIGGKGVAPSALINEMLLVTRETPSNWLHFVIACRRTLYDAPENAARRLKVGSLAHLHREYDANGDGFLQLGEFKALCRENASFLDEAGVQLATEEDVEALFAKLDMDSSKALSLLELGYMVLISSGCDVDD